jgi:CRP-like cAMP-binding protein
LPEQVLDEIADISRTRRLTHGQPIAVRGEPIEGVVGVVRGAVWSSSSSEAGRDMAFSVVPAGGLWGIVAVLDHNGAVHDAKAVGLTELILLPTSGVHSILKRHPDLHRVFALILCHRMRKNYAAVEELGLATLRQRLARQLCTLVTASGQAQLAVTQESLADLIGASRPNVNRQLKDMERNGMLSQRYGGVTVLNYERLHELCATEEIYQP